MDYDSRFKQIFLCILVSATQISSGMTLAFPAVALPALQASLGFISPQDDNAFWIVSLPQISMVLGCLSAGPVLDFKGRRFTLLLSNLIALSGWFLMAVIPQLWSILVSRLLTGFALGFVNPAVPVYVSEIAEPDLRSGLTVVNAVTFSLGITLTNLFGYFYRVEWRTVSWLCGMFPLICWLLMLFVLPEPKLVRKKASWNKDSFKRPEVYKPMVIMLIALFFRQMCGTNIFISYAVEMAEQAKVIIDYYLAAVLLGIVRLLAAVLSVWLSLRLGRRLPIICSGLSMALSLTSLAVSFQLPSFALLMLILSSTIHTSTIQSMTAEVFPTNIRGVATSIASVSSFFVGFLAIWVHQGLRLDITTMFSYYTALGFSSTLFAFFYIPETHGKSLGEIERIFSKNQPTNKEILLKSSKKPTFTYQNKT